MPWETVLLEGWGLSDEVCLKESFPKHAPEGRHRKPLPLHPAIRASSVQGLHPQTLTSLSYPSQKGLLLLSPIHPERSDTGHQLPLGSLQETTEEIVSYLTLTKGEGMGTGWGTATKGKERIRDAGEACLLTLICFLSTYLLF